MLVMTINQASEEVHIYVSRWTRGARYPERVLDFLVSFERGVRGRDTLRLACVEVIKILDEIDLEHNLTE